MKDWQDFLDDDPLLAEEVTYKEAVERGIVSEKEKVVPISVIEDIKSEIKDSTKCPYGRCIGGNKCANMNDCMIMGEHVISIIDKHISGKEKTDDRII